MSFTVLRKDGESSHRRDATPARPARGGAAAFTGDLRPCPRGGSTRAVP